MARKKILARSAPAPVPTQTPSSSPGGKRERNKLANREAILEAARKCFLKQGYDAVTVRDVIRMTGLAAGTFYNYFPDKDTLFRAVLETRMNDLNAAMHAVRGEAYTIDSFIHGAFLTLFTRIAEDPGFFRLILRNEHAVRTLFQDSVVGIPMRALKADLGDAIERGIFPPMDIDLMTSAFFGVGFEIGRTLSVARRPDPEAAAAFAARLMTAGVQAFGIQQGSSARRKKGEVAIRGSLP